LLLPLLCLLLLLCGASLTLEQSATEPSPGEYWIEGASPYSLGDTQKALERARRQAAKEIPLPKNYRSS